MLKSISALALFHYTYNILGIHKLRKPNTIPAEEKLVTVLAHPFGIDSQDDRLTMPLTDFRGRLNSCGKVDIKPLAFQYALLQDGGYCPKKCVCTLTRKKKDWPLPTNPESL